MDNKNLSDPTPSLTTPSDINMSVQPAPPTTPNVVQNSNIPSQEPQQKPTQVSSADTPLKITDSSKPKKKRFRKLFLVLILLLLFSGSVGGAYLLGRSNERIVEKEEELLPINLPPQAVLLEECLVGRGKQYILPKDIPVGPIYDVVNSKVVALEYNLNLAEIQANPDSLSNTILQLVRVYPVDHFSLIPAPGKEGEGLKNILLIMFVVSKDEAKTITCS